MIDIFYLESLAAQGNATSDSVGPLVVQLTLSLEGAVDSLSLLSVIGPISSGTSNDSVAELVAQIVGVRNSILHIQRHSDVFLGHCRNSRHSPNRDGHRRRFRTRIRCRPCSR